ASVACQRHAERGCQAGARMADGEGVVRRLAGGGEAGQAATLPDGLDTVGTSGEDLVAVRLVPDVPHDPVLERVEQVVEGDGQLDRTEARSQVAASHRADADDLAA